MLITTKKLRRKILKSAGQSLYLRYSYLYGTVYSISPQIPPADL